MKNEFNFKKKRTLKRLEEQQTRAFILSIISLLFAPIFLTYFSDIGKQYILNDQIFLYVSLISIFWVASISCGVYSLYNFLRLEKTLYKIRVDF